MGELLDLAMVYLPNQSRSPWNREPGARWCCTMSVTLTKILIVEVEFLPDVSQYPAACLFSSGFILPNGKAAQLYDNTCEGVVDLHFQWMQQAGVDGVVVQRFLSALNDATFTTVLNQVRTAAEKYGLGFLVEYDVSGANSVSGGAATEVLTDYNNKIKAYTTSSAYIHQNGKPVVMAFGFASTALGFGPTPADGLNMLNGFKAAGAYIGVGPPSTWSNEISGNTAWAPVLKAANLISPWTVGSYSNGGYQAGYFTQIQKPDVAYVFQNITLFHSSPSTQA